MKPWTPLSRRWLPLAAAATLLLAACGGGGDAANLGVPVLPSIPGTSNTDPLASAQPPSSSVAGVCTPAAEKQFVRSYLDEVYLWYDEIPTVNPASYASTADYFRALLISTPDRTGAPRDRYSAVLSSTGAQAVALRSEALSALLAAEAATPAVPLTKTVTSPGGRQVGYLLFNDHAPGAQDALIASFAELRRAAVQDLVLDLRYNSGGFLYVARSVASMVVGPESDGRVFEQLRYNNKRAAEGGPSTYFFSGQVQSGETRFQAGMPLPQLGLQRLYVLSSELTCSASESIINSLRGIDVQVILVGATTCGKPFGFRRQDNCGLAFYPVEFQGYNAKNYGDFIDGFAPTCPVRDDSGKALGAADEPLLAAALHHADTGACPAPGTNGLRKQSLAGALAVAPRAHAPPRVRASWDGKLVRP